MRRIILFSILFILIVAVWLRVAPPRIWLNTIHEVDISPEAGAALVVEKDCRNCHRIEDSGALVGPELNGITQRVDPMVLRIWLRNPRSIKSNTPMPNFHLSDTEIEAIMAYLDTLQ